MFSRFMDYFNNSITKSGALQDKIIKTIFDNIRNATLSVLVFWSGVYFYKNSSYGGKLEYFFNVVIIDTLVFGGIVLYIINILHGYKKLLETKLHTKITTILFVIYYLAMTVFFVVIYKTKKL